MLTENGRRDITQIIQKLDRRLRNAKSRINTAFFVVKIKYLLKIYGKIELQETTILISAAFRLPLKFFLFFRLDAFLCLKLYT